jgi:uncharacterized protein YegL
VSDFHKEESYPVFPVFLLIDVSYSMEGEPIDAVNRSLPELKDAIESDPTVGEIARVGVITFSDDARLALPLCDLMHADLPVLRPENGTNFAEAFRTARIEIETGLRDLGKGTKFYRPVVFFLSDGENVAPDDWTWPLRELTDRSWKFSPEIVTFGFGNARPETLGKIATRHAFMARNGNPADQVREIISTLIGSIKSTSGSLQSGQGGLIVEPDPNKFTPLPVSQV